MSEKAEGRGAAAGRAAAEASAVEDVNSEAIRHGFELALISYVLWGQGRGRCER